MTTLNTLLDQAQQQCDRPSDIAIADALGVSRSAVSLWRKGGVIAEKHLAALVSLAKADPATALAVMAEQATTKPEAAVWGSLLRRVTVAASIAIATLIPLGNGHAKTLENKGFFASNAYYVNTWPVCSVEAPIRCCRPRRQISGTMWVWPLPGM